MSTLNNRINEMARTLYKLRNKSGTYVFNQAVALIKDDAFVATGEGGSE